MRKRNEASGRRFEGLNREYISTIPCDTQNHTRRLGRNRGFETRISATQCADKPGKAGNIENTSGLPKFLTGQIQAVNRLAQALEEGSSNRMRPRIYHPQLVDSLIFQTQMLTSILSSYVIPRLEQTDNSKK